MRTKIIPFAFALLFVWGAGTRVVAQDPEDGEKGIKSAEVMGDSRQSAVQPNTKPHPAPHPAPHVRRPPATYTATKKRTKTPPTKGQEDVRVGLTIFRFEPPGTTYSNRPDGTKDIGVGGAEQAPTPPEKVVDWKPSDWTRATAKTQFAVGQVVRLHIEPLTQSGYFYIVHQELYADGTVGSPTLLFPTLNLNGGNNFISAHEDLWVPRAGAFFRIKPSTSNKDHVGELFTVIVRAESPAQLLSEPIGKSALALTNDEFKKLTQGAVESANDMNLDDGNGAKLTPRETPEGRKDVGVEGEEVLNEDDALPQTVYETRRQAGQPVLMRIPLRFIPESPIKPPTKSVGSGTSGKGH